MPAGPELEGESSASGIDVGEPRGRKGVALRARADADYEVALSPTFPSALYPSDGSFDNLERQG
jgi:hypothetical protein